METEVFKTMIVDRGPDRGCGAGGSNNGGRIRRGKCKILIFKPYHAFGINNTAIKLEYNWTEKKTKRKYMVLAGNIWESLRKVQGWSRDLSPMNN